MAGLRSAYELKKWQAIQKTASAPLQRVIDGQYTQKDVDALGSALKTYDDLAYSVFAEGVRLAELSAAERAESIQTKRKARSKQPLTARQMAIIYGQAVEKAQKETMPTLLAAISEMLEAKDGSLEEATENIPELPKKKNHLMEAPKLKLQNFNLDRVAKDMEAANEDLADDTLAKIKKHDEDTWESKLDQIKELLGDKGGKKEPKETPFEKAVRAIHESLEALRAEFVGSPTAKPVVAQPENKDSPPVKSTPGTIKPARKSAPSAVKKFGQGLLSFFGYGAKTKRPKPESIPEPKGDKMNKSKDLVDPENPKGRGKDETNGLMKFIKAKYDKVAKTGGLKDKGNALMLLAVGLVALGGVVQGYIERFKDIDLMEVIKDTFSKSYEWVVDKIYAFLGIDRHPKTDPADNLVNKAATGAVESGARPVAAAAYDWGSKANDKLGFTANWDKKRAENYMGSHTFDPQEAKEFEKTYGVKVPEDQIIVNAPPTEKNEPVRQSKMTGAAALLGPKPEDAPTSATPDSSSGAPAPASPAAPQGATGGGADASGTSSATPSSTAKPTTADPATPGMRTDATMPMTTPSRGGKANVTVAVSPQAAAASSTKPVIATPPPAPAPEAKHAPSSSGGGGGSPSLGLATIPSSSATSERNVLINLKGLC